MTGLRKESQDWLVTALDPYHDNQMVLQGLPDTTTAPSVVQMHNQSYTLTAPTVAGTGNWDATVAFTGCGSTIDYLPVLKLHTAADNNVYDLYDHASLTARADPFGSFVIKAAAAGSVVDWGGSYYAGTTNVAFGSSLPDSVGSRCRLIAVGFEITNTTAEIYKQGSLTVAALPTPVSDYNTVEVVDNNASPYIAAAHQSWKSPMFAATRDDLVRIPGSQSWPAADGVYAIPRLQGNTFPTDFPDKCGRVAVVQGSTYPTRYAMTEPDSYINTGSGYLPSFPGVMATPFGALQVFLTGLSNATTLFITMRTVVEYFPTPLSSLLPLCTPSPSYEPKAFELYTEIVREAPYAVTVDQNSAGEYFRKVLKLVGNVGQSLVPIAGPFSAPVLAVSTAAKSLAKEMRPMTKAAKPGKKKKQVSKKELRIARREAGASASPTRR